MCPTEDPQPQGCLSPFLGPLRNLFGPHRKQLLPQDDPFYGYHRTEADLKQHPPGTILATRSIQMKPWFGLNVDQLLVWEIAYVTTGPKGAEVTVCTVVVPPNAGERAKVVVQCPKTDSAAPICRTSYALREGNGGPTDGASEQIFMAPFLDRGYIVVLPDYEGQRDAFGCGSISGQSTLDSIRATLACADLKLAPKDKMRFVVWGYSGGAIASSWAAQSLATYAPELQPVIVGFSMGGVPANLLSCAISVNDSIAAGLIIGIFQGLANAYPHLQQWVDTNTTKEGKDVFQVARTKCFASFITDSFLKDVLNLVPDSTFNDHTKYFSMDTNPLLEPIPLSLVQENSLGAAFTATKESKLIPKVPIYIYQAISDYVVPIDTIDTLVKMWSSNGASIEYVKIKKWLHIGAIFANASENTEWIADRLEAKEPRCGQGKCVVSEEDREIADDKSKESLKNKRAEQLLSYYETVYDKKDKPWW